MSIVKATASQYAQSLLSLKGRPLSFTNYKPWKLIYDISPDFMVLIAGRQIGKSVSLAGRSIIQSIATPYFNTLYVAPFQIQAKRFSNAYVDPFINSDLIKKFFKAKSNVKNVYEKSLAKGSIIYLSYAQDETDADRIRGIMADQILVDEVQDVIYSAIPPILEVASASPFGYKVFSGTAKSTSNTLELLWQDTCKFEWITKCQACNYYNIPYTYDNCMKICSQSEKGPSCIKCGRLLDMSLGQWIATNPNNKKKIGFHLPQFIMTANTSEKRWPKFYDKVIQAAQNGLYSPAKVSNEVFGISTDLAGKTFSVSDLIACSNGEKTEFYKDKPEGENFETVVMGIDWSATGSILSFTVCTILGVKNDGKVMLLYTEKMQGIDTIAQVDKIYSLFKQYKCDMIGMDRGMGVTTGQMLQRRVGLKKAVHVQYVRAKLSVRWDQQGQFISADRTRAIDNVVMKIKQGRDRFEAPCFDIMKPFWQDCLHIFEEETAMGTRIYSHHPEEPDDFLHSLVFADIAYRYATGDFSFIDETDPSTRLDVMTKFEEGPIISEYQFENLDGYSF